MNEKVNVSCLECGSTNAFPSAAGGKTVVCGRCKAALPPPGRVLDPTERQVVTLIEKATLPLLLDFHSPSCAPCRMMHPIVEALARRRAGDLMVVRADTGAMPQVGAAFRIQAVPTFVVLHRGVERGRVSGAMNETDFSLWVASKA